MTGAEEGFAGLLGAALAIAAMTAATYLCRISGVLLMSRVRLTPAVERGLRALPGAIVAATIVPIGFRSGPAGIAGIAVGILVMRVVHNELAALLAGMAAAAAIRAYGL